MKSSFSSDFFAANRRRLHELFRGSEPMVLAANGLLQRGGDSSYPFAQDANFWYLTGLNEPDLVLVMDGSKDYIIVPGRSDSRQAFDGTIDEAALSQRSGIEHIVSEAAGWELLGKRAHKSKHIAMVVPTAAYVSQYGLYVNPARAAVAERLKSYNSELELLDISSHFAHMRMIKQPVELDAIRRAIDITTTTLKRLTVPKTLATFKTEYELEAELSRDFRRRGGSGHAFEPIVASGDRACTLHYIANNGPIAKAELLVLDVGAEVEHYASDITRTVSPSEPTRRQQAVYDAVLSVQDFALSLIKPGIHFKNYEMQVVRFMGEKLRELGLIKTIEPHAVRKYYPHATSHFMGLNVHDIGDYGLPLEAGVVMTIEPGIYIPEEGIGVRIEDDILVTQTGAQVLSAGLPRRLQ